MVVPGDGHINTHFLKTFATIIKRQIKKGKRFIIVTGGGRTCRVYQQAAGRVRRLTPRDLDWLGIYTTHLNAQLVRTVFGDLAEEEINMNPTVKSRFRKPILIGAGWKPGCSTDHDAVLLALDYGAQTIINLSNIDHVYDRDPQKYPTAKKLDRVSWSAYRQIIGKHWTPGANWPFDPVASRLAAKTKLTVLVMNGKKLKNFESHLNSQRFSGTVIS